MPRPPGCWVRSCSPRLSAGEAWATSCGGWTPRRKPRSSTCLAAAGCPKPSIGPVDVREGGPATKLDLHHGRDDSRTLRRGSDRAGRRRPSDVDPRSLLVRRQYALPLRAGPRSTAADASVRLGGPSDDRARVRPGDPHPASPRSAAARRARRGGQHRPLSDLDALASTAAGHGMQLVTIWHDLAQINARYGARAATVANNHRAKLFLSGISDPSTLDYASHLIGDEEVVLPTTTVGGERGPSTSHSPSVRRLAPPDACAGSHPGRAYSCMGTSSGPAPPADLVRGSVVAGQGWGGLRVGALPVDGPTLGAHRAAGRRGRPGK